MSANLGSYGSSALGAFLQSALAARGHGGETPPEVFNAVRVALIGEYAAVSASEVVALGPGGDHFYSLGLSQFSSAPDPSIYAVTMDSGTPGVDRVDDADDFTASFSDGDKINVTEYQPAQALPQAALFYYCGSVSASTITLSDAPSSGSDVDASEDLDPAAAFVAFEYDEYIAAPAGESFVGYDADYLIGQDDSVSYNLRIWDRSDGTAINTYRFRANSSTLGATDYVALSDYCFDGSSSYFVGFQSACTIVIDVSPNATLNNIWVGPESFNNSGGADYSGNVASRIFQVGSSLVLYGTSGWCSLSGGTFSDLHRISDSITWDMNTWYSVNGYLMFEVDDSGDSGLVCLSGSLTHQFTHTYPGFQVAGAYFDGSTYYVSLGRTLNGDAQSVIAEITAGGTVLWSTVVTGALGNRSTSAEFVLSGGDLYLHAFCRYGGAHRTLIKPDMPLASSDLVGITVNVETAPTITTHAEVLPARTMNTEWDDTGLTASDCTYGGDYAATPGALNWATSEAAPVVAISEPADAATVEAGVSQTFTATAYDEIEGDLSDDIAWSSDIDGALGTGDSISASLTAGEHTITASVDDSNSNSGTDTITVTAAVAGDPPEATITSPASLSQHAVDTLVNFTATATDTEDGDVSASINWAMPFESPPVTSFGTGASASYTFNSTGFKYIEITAEDGFGQTDTYSLIIEII